MPRIDPFTRKRIEKFIEDFRAQFGQLPTLNDFESIGIDAKKIDEAVRDGFISEFYVTLTNGVVKKGYKLKIPSAF